MLHYLTYLLFRVFIPLLYLLPFRAVYIFSDFMYIILYHLVGYRKAVVYGNLRNSFPEKKEADIERIAKSFYHHLCDMLIESLKAFTMKETDVMRRYRYHNTGFMEEFYKQGRSVICVAGHYANWEWAGLASGMQLVHKPVGFYKPLSNQYIDRYMQRTRVKGRSKLAAITQTAETFSADYGEPAAFYMVADQSPSSPRLAYWVNFLNQDTAVLHGPEKYARIHDLPVVFAHIRKIRRGYYEIEFRLLEEHSAKTKTGQITGRFMQMLEEEILEAPAYYLWSHRRWKLKKS